MLFLLMGDRSDRMHGMFAFFDFMYIIGQLPRMMKPELSFGERRQQILCALRHKLIRR